MMPNMLSHTVRELMRPTEFLNAEDSLDRAATLLRRANAPWVPVMSASGLRGVVTEARLGERIAEGCDLAESLDGVVDSTVETIGPYASGAEALRRINENKVQALLVVDDGGQVLGVLAPSDLAPRRPFQLIPNSIGGMATPFGVYFTSGSVVGGVPRYALVATGILLGTLLVISLVITGLVVNYLTRFGWFPRISGVVDTVLPSVLFFGSIRLLPLSGTHGAEHMVVHAIERGEALVPEIVSRMPRVHPRCGTNLAVGATLFLGIATSPWFGNEETRLLIAAIATFVLWRSLGAILQHFVTTKTPSKKQLEGAIQSGYQILDEYRHSRIATPSLWMRVWNSGVILVMVGSMMAVFLLESILVLTGRVDLLFGP
jgi:hypothetical protein